MAGRRRGLAEPGPGTAGRVGGSAASVFSIFADGCHRARRRLAQVVTPLLLALRAHTGYHLTLIGGRVDGPAFELVSVHAGKTKTALNGIDGALDFTEWDKRGYERVLGQFMRFLVAAGK